MTYCTLYIWQKSQGWETSGILVIIYKCSAPLCKPVFVLRSTCCPRSQKSPAVQKCHSHYLTLPANMEFVTDAWTLSV